MQIIQAPGNKAIFVPVCFAFRWVQCFFVPKGIMVFPLGREGDSSFYVVEQVQRNSARYVMGNYDRRSSVTALLSKLQWPTLQSRRQQYRLAMLFRMRFDLVDIDWKEHLTSLTSITRGHASRFWIPHCSSQVFSSSFFPCTCREWNALKKDPADCPSLDAFQTALRDAVI